MLSGPDLQLASSLGDREVLLRVDTIEWTRERLVSDWTQLRESSPAPSELPWPKYYARVATHARIFRVARAEGFEAEAADDAAMLERAVARDRLYRERLEEALRDESRRDGAALEQFFRDNQFLYVTPLRLRIRTLSLPVDRAAGERLRELERGRESIAAGRETFVDLARRTGAELSEERWESADSLATFERKVAYYLMDEPAGGVTVPFQFNHRISMVEVLERRDPEPKPYDQVAERVLDDYVNRHRSQLYDDLARRKLAEIDFEFREAAVRARISPAAPQPPE